MSRHLEVGDRAPAFHLTDQQGDRLRLSAHKGHRVLVYFYPRADTPGCTTQACGLRDAAPQLGDTVVIGISPDPPERLARFEAKHDLGFTLLSDPDHVAAQKYGVWAEKRNYGKTSWGIVRSAFLVSPAGKLEAVWYDVKAKDTAAQLLDALAAAG